MADRLLGGSMFVQLVEPRTGTVDRPGMCLQFTQTVFRAPVAHPSATAAANATKFRHATREMPNVSVPVWFDHWGTYGAPATYANWGHVVTWVPGRGFLSSPGGTAVSQVWLGSIAEVERYFACTFRFWSEDLNGLRIAEGSSETAPAKRRNVLGRMMFNIYVTGPAPSQPNKHARLITEYGSFHIPNAQLLELLLRRRNDTIVAEPTMNVQSIGNQMLDAEHDIMNAFLRTCLQSSMLGVQLDPAKFLAAINDGFKALGKSITVKADSVDLDPADLAKAFELAAPRIVKAMGKAVAE